MATKKDLIEAQEFSRRRLLTAFTSGAPGGKELEPAKPLRAVAAGVALAAIVVLGGVFYGLIRPGMPAGWENNALVLVTDTGARYVSQNGTLHPVLNTASARLLMPAGEYDVIPTDQGAIAGIPIGGTVGILGAPDDLPAPGDLVSDGWTACVVEGGTALTIGDAPLAERTGGGVVVVRGDDRFVIAGGTRYAVDAESADAVLRAVGVNAAAEAEVDGRWLNLFAPGADLEPLQIPGAGEPVEGTSFVVGTAVHLQGSAENERFVITDDGELAALSPVAYQLYLLGTGADLGAAVEVGPGEIADLPTAETPAGGADWPDAALEALDSTAAPCALLAHDETGAERTVLAAAAPADLPAEGDSVEVSVDSGALIRAGADGGLVHLIDATGTAFAVPGADEEILGRLGFESDDVTEVAATWLQFLPAGPELTVEAAGSSPVASADAVLAECRPGAVELTADTPPALALLDAATAQRLATGAGVTVAVVDSGVDASNPHLAGAVVGGVDLVGDGEGAGGLADPLGHGTAVAGVIAARPVDGSGVVGLAPEADLLSVRVFRGTDQQSVDNGYGPNAARIAAGIRWAVDNGADVVNVSLSMNADVAEVRDAVAYAASSGALVVASAGNRASTEDTSDSPRYPAANPGALAVTAADGLGVVTDDSIHGSHVEIAAPGTDVLTAATGGGDCVFGTAGASSSFATGYASAAAALVAQAHPSESPAQWEYRLQVTADRADPDRRDDLAGWGLLRPAAAITVLPDAALRGPASPFAESAAPPVTPPVQHLVPDHAPSPFMVTRDGILLLAVGGAAALGVLGTLAILRLRRTLPERAEIPPRRGGLLDRVDSPV